MRLQYCLSTSLYSDTFDGDDYRPSHRARGYQEHAGLTGKYLNLDRMAKQPTSFPRISIRSAVTLTSVACDLLIHLGERKRGQGSHPLASFCEMASAPRGRGLHRSFIITDKRCSDDKYEGK